MTKSTEKISLQDFDIQIIRSKRRRSLQLEIKNQQVSVRAPYYFPRFFIRKFVNKKQGWILRHLSNQQPVPKEKQFKEDEVFNLFDQTFKLHITTAATGTINFGGQQLVITVPKRVKNQKPYIRKRMIEWYKQTALDYIQSKVEHFSTKMGVQSKSIKVREYKSRWGSCSSKGELSFNWRIVMAPQAAIDYVIIHELAHLKEFNHSKRFWLEVERLMPEYKLQIQWFKQNANKLHF